MKEQLFAKSTTLSETDLEPLVRDAWEALTQDPTIAAQLEKEGVDMEDLRRLDPDAAVRVTTEESGFVGAETLIILGLTVVQKVTEGVAIGLITAAIMDWIKEEKGSQAVEKVDDAGGDSST